MTSDLVVHGEPDDRFEWPGHSGTLHLRLFRADRRRPTDDLLVFFPPGGFTESDPEAADPCLRVLADTCRINLLAPSYAVAPQCPFPAAVEDAYAVLHHTLQAKGRLGWRGTRLFAGGVEAGGNLAAVSALVCRDRQGPALSGQVLITPMLDASLQCPSMRCAADEPTQRGMAHALEQGYRSYLPRPADRLHPYASPLQATRLGGLPPALIMHAQGDPLSDEGRAYARKLRQAGIEVEEIDLPQFAGADAQERCALTSDAPSVIALNRFLGRTPHPPPLGSGGVTGDPTASSSP